MCGDKHHFRWLSFQRAERLFRHNLLTFLFPVTPLVPSTAENAMELLSVAQKYQMGSVLAHIRLSIARQFHHLPREVPHSTRILLRKGTDFAKKHFKPRELY